MTSYLLHVRLFFTIRHHSLTTRAGCNIIGDLLAKDNAKHLFPSPVLLNNGIQLIVAKAQRLQKVNGLCQFLVTLFLLAHLLPTQRTGATPAKILKVKTLQKSQLAINGSCWLYQ